MSANNPTVLERLVMRWNEKYPAGAGHLEADLITFGEMVIEEVERLRNVELARVVCRSGGGHFFSFLSGQPMGGEIVYENGKTTISGWRGCDVKCDNCDAWLVIKYEEEEI